MTNNLRGNLLIEEKEKQKQTKKSSLVIIKYPFFGRGGKSYKSETDSYILIPWWVSAHPLATFLRTNWPQSRRGLLWPLGAQRAPSQGKQEGLQAKAKLLTGNQGNCTRQCGEGQQGPLRKWEAGSPQKEFWWPPGGCSSYCLFQATLPTWSAKLLGAASDQA